MEIVLNPFIGTIFNLFLISALVITMYTLNFYSPSASYCIQMLLHAFKSRICTKRWV